MKLPATLLAVVPVAWMLALAMAGRAEAAVHAALSLARIPAGELSDRALAETPVAVRAFSLMTRPVRNDEFLAFVRSHPAYRRDKIARAFADPQYLAHFLSATQLGPTARPHQPVTHVSWFAARAFCAAYTLRLPTEIEWEYVAAASESARDARADPVFRRRILDWYARPVHELPDVPKGPQNIYGIYDLHGTIWEWVEDFNAQLQSADSRAQRDGTVQRSTCGAGAVRANDAADYPAFLRFGFRSSLEASYTTSSLGFRCAR